MSRRLVITVGAAVAAVVAVAVAFVVWGGEEPPAASPTPSASASPQPSASSNASATASASPSAAPSVSPSPSEAAGPPQVAWEPFDAVDDAAELFNVAFVDGQWFAAGEIDGLPAIWRSDDGRSWSPTNVATTVTETEWAWVSDVVALNGTLIAIGSWGAIESDQVAWATWRSTDGGANWTEDRTDSAAARAVTAGGPGLAAAGWDYFGTLPFNSWMSLTADGQTWERVDSDSLVNSEVHALTVLGERLIAVGNRSTPSGYAPAAWVSDDAGETWRLTEPGSPSVDSLGSVSDITLLGDVAVAVGRSGDAQSSTPFAWLSTDGETWRQEVMGEDATANAISAVDGGVVAVGNGSGLDPGPEVAWTSADGILWAESGPLSAGSGVRGLSGAAGAGDVVIASVTCRGDPCGPRIWRGEVSSAP